MLAHHEKLRPNFSSFPLEILFSFSPFFAILVLSWFSFFLFCVLLLKATKLESPFEAEKREEARLLSAVRKMSPRPSFEVPRRDDRRPNSRKHRKSSLE